MKAEYIPQPNRTTPCPNGKSGYAGLPALVPKTSNWSGHIQLNTTSGVSFNYNTANTQPMPVSYVVTFNKLIANNTRVCDTPWTLNVTSFYQLDQVCATISLNGVNKS